MKKDRIISEAENVAKKQGFEIDKLIYKGVYYKKDILRNVIFSGEYRGKSAVLKYYNDPRPIAEPLSQQSFLEKNKSTKLKAPALYNFKLITPFQGWLIMEKLPEGCKSFGVPVSDKERQKFLEIYVEYRQSFPAKPTRSLVLREFLPAEVFNIHRIHRWFELAQNREIENSLKKEPLVINSDEFIPRLLCSISFIEKTFRGRKMIWCHGHFKPPELFFDPAQSIYYLTDFAHSCLQPEGNELGFMIWSDILLGMDWRAPFSKRRAGIDAWIKDLQGVATELSISGYDDLVRASLVERCLGTILADVVASDKEDEEKRKRIADLYKVIDTYIG